MNLGDPDGPDGRGDLGALGDRLGDALRHRAASAVPPTDGAEQIARHVRRRRRAAAQRRVLGGAAGALVVVLLAFAVVARRTEQRLDTLSPPPPTLAPATTMNGPPAGSTGRDPGTTSTSAPPPPTPSTVAPSRPASGPSTLPIASTMPPPGPQDLAAPGLPWLSLAGFELTRATVRPDGLPAGDVTGPLAGWTNDDGSIAIIKVRTDAIVHGPVPPGATPLGDHLLYASASPSGLHFSLIDPGDGRGEAEWSTASYEVVGIDAANAERIVREIEAATPTTFGPAPVAPGDPYLSVVHLADGTTLSLVRPSAGGYQASFRLGDVQVGISAVPAGLYGWRGEVLGPLAEGVSPLGTVALRGRTLWKGEHRRGDTASGHRVVWSPNPDAVLVVDANLSADDLVDLLATHLVRQDETTWRALAAAIH